MQTSEEVQLIRDDSLCMLEDCNLEQERKHHSLIQSFYRPRVNLQQVQELKCCLVFTINHQLL